MSQLCREVIVKAADGLESHMDRFFIPDFGHGRVQMMYELFVELYKIIPQNLTCFVLKLDTMLQSKDDAIRLEVSPSQLDIGIGNSTYQQTNFIRRHRSGDRVRGEVDGVYGLDLFVPTSSRGFHRPVQ